MLRLRGFLFDRKFAKFVMLLRGDTNDVRTGREYPIKQTRVLIQWQGARGGGCVVVSKNPEILLTSFEYGPLL